MEKRSLLTLVGGTKRHLAQKRNQSTIKGTNIKRHIVTNPPTKNAYDALKVLPKKGFEQKLDSPFFLELQPYLNRVAITDSNGDFTYEELFKRSLYLSLEIRKALRNQPNKNQKINLVCPNGASYVIGQWAIWMTGNIVVPLSGQHSEPALEYFIKDSDSALIISAPDLLQKVENVSKKLEKPLICLDPQSQNHKNLKIQDDGIFPSPIFNDNLYPKDEPVMMLYLPNNQQSEPQRLLLKHKDLNREMDMVSKVWSLDNNSSLLHALSLYNPFGVIASLMSPLSVGGKVVILPQFDTCKVWSHLLGIQINGEYVPRTNIYAGVPTHFENLTKRHKEVFTDPKIKNYVKETCSKRINLMVNGNDYMKKDLHQEWNKITGHSIQLY